MTPAAHHEVPPQHRPFDAAAFDRRCRRYLGLQVQMAAMKKQADELKAMILLDVDTSGFIPETAPRSRRVGSQAFVATVTTAIGIEVNHDRVFELELLLSRARCHNTFPQLFERHVEYSLAKTAPETIETVQWPKRYAGDIMQVYALCTKPKVKAPSLEVASRAEVAERERLAAEKIAKKAAGRSRKVAA